MTMVLHTKSQCAGCVAVVKAKINLAEGENKVWIFLQAIKVVCLYRRGGLEVTNKSICEGYISHTLLPLRDICLVLQ